MATTNPFDLLGDDAEDPSQLIVAEQLKAAAAPPAAKKGAVKEQGKPNKPALLPSKPTPPAQAVRESRNEGGRGGRGFGGRGGDRDRGFGGRGGDRGFGGGRGGRGFGRDYSNDDNSFPASGAPENQGPVEEGDRNSERRSYGGPRGPYRGGRRGGFNNGDAGEEGRPRRTFERHSGTGRGNDFKREGAGRGNWGTETDEITQVTEEVMNEGEKNLGDEKPAVEADVAEGNKDSPANEAEEKEPEDKEMTLEEYEKVLEEKRKALQTLKTEERKVDTKAFETMQALSCKKDNTEIFAKLGADKDKRKEAYDKEEKAKKSVSINEFLKPAEGESHYNSGGRGRGRGGRGARGGGFRGNSYSNVPAPSIEDPGHFPTLGAK